MSQNSERLQRFPEIQQKVLTLKQSILEKLKGEYRNDDFSAYYAMAKDVLGDGLKKADYMDNRERRGASLLGMGYEVGVNGVSWRIRMAQSMGIDQTHIATLVKDVIENNMDIDGGIRSYLSIHSTNKPLLKHIHRGYLAMQQTYPEYALLFQPVINEIQQYLPTQVNWQDRVKNFFRPEKNRRKAA